MNHHDDPSLVDGAPPSPVSDNDQIPAVVAPSVEPTASQKLTIRVPVQYQDYMTPPSSADIVPRRHSLMAKRVSASLAKDGSDNSPSSPIPPPAPAPTFPLPAVPEAQRDILPTNQQLTPPSSSASESGEATPRQAQSDEHMQSSPPHSVRASVADGSTTIPPPPPIPQDRGSSLTPPTASNLRQRRKSAPQQPPKTQTPRVRNSPSHVSLIDFDSSEDEEEESPARDKDSAPSIPEEQDQDPDWSRWAPEPAFIPAHVPISANDVYPSRQVGSSQPPSMRSRSSLRSNDRDANRRANSSGQSLTLSKSFPAPVSSRDNKHHALLGLSALPNELVQRDIDYTLRALMNPQMFARMLGDPLARQRFREFLLQTGGRGAKDLDFWTDARYLQQSMDQLRAAGLAFRDLYVSGNPTEPPMAITPEMRREMRAVLQQVLASDAGLGTTQAQLLESMYDDGFQRFVKHQIIQEAHVALGRANLNLASNEFGEGLGDTFVLTNPRLPDHPIVLVSDGFVAVTGYPRSQIIGRNCRFLQGPGTPPASVQRIRDGLNSGTGCTELLLNYRRDGEPFYCLLCIIPVRDASGSIVYFIGGQTNVTGLLMTEKGFKGLHGIGTSKSTNDPAPAQMSPAMATQCGVPSSPIRSPDASMSPRTGAAGAVMSPGGSPGERSSRMGSGFFKGLFGRGGGVQNGEGSGNAKQIIAGAEAMMNGTGEMRFQDQYAIFQHTYNKVLIFKFKKRAITFASSGMLAYLGLPTRTQREQLASPLIRSDVTSLITAAGDDRNETRRLREELKEAVRRGDPCSMYCGVKVPGKGLLSRGENRVRQGMLHMTPIKDADNVSVAFVVIFS
ncbi:hypothetical protein HMN09_00966400 [Mycena chlorophos]|uniref:PAS domain-containing protein n=1 Tax=Mycena chlorophos TaxID=658473 RepID=A0A8H6SIX0_MYCCL|nr:hypothetical protein HMN09_00966400 [Mycena chlorophos]